MRSMPFLRPVRVRRGSLHRRRVLRVSTAWSRPGPTERGAFKKGNELDMPSPIWASQIGHFKKGNELDMPRPNLGIPNWALIQDHIIRTKRTWRAVQERGMNCQRLDPNWADPRSSHQ